MESFIDDTAEKEKLVVLTTGRLDSWKPESRRVDAMSSASVMTQAATIGKLLAEKALESATIFDALRWILRFYRPGSRVEVRIEPYI